MEEQENAAQTKRVEERGKNKDYPLIDLETSLEVARVAIEMKGKATKKDISDGIKKKGGTLIRRIASARQWNLIKGQGEISATKIAEKILKPLNDKEVEEGKREAYFSVKIFKELYEDFKWELPRKDLLVNYLERKKDIKKEDAIKLSKMIYFAKNKLFSDKQESFEEESPIEDEEESEPTEVLPKKSTTKKINLGKGLFETIENIFRLELEIKTSFDKNKIDLFLKKLKELSEKERMFSVKSHLGNIETDMEIIGDEDTLKKLLPLKIEKMILDLKEEMGFNNHEDKIGEGEEPDLS